MGSLSGLAEKTLAVHNALRAAHGAPPLEWSDECAEYAQMQADKMAADQAIGHDNKDQPSGTAGQNVATKGQPMSLEEIAEHSIKMWYNEVNDPGYSFDGDFMDNPNYGFLHFTQVVWAETTHIGLAVNMSDAGQYVCANYLPAGNMMMEGYYPTNVMASSMGTDFDTIVAAAPTFSGGEEEEE